MDTLTGKKVVWILSALSAPLIFYAGLLQVEQAPFMVELFSGWGYPRVFMVAVGSIQLIGAISLLIPPWATFAAGALGVVMIGAIVTLLSAGNVAWAAISLIVLGMVLFIGLERSRTRTHWIETHSHREEHS